MKTILKVENLEKSFKDKKVLKGINFELSEGEILCFLGPNGAGKSTTINILTTALGYDTGRITMDGDPIEKNIRKVKASLGIVPQDLAIYEELSAEQNVSFFASLYGLRGSMLKKSVEEALEFVGLTERKKDKAKTFSGGMKRRLNIACAIAHKPRVIIMDEPTVGIDPQSRNHILESIKRMRDEGSTIVYTTHYMEEVEEISTRIIIIDHGKLIAEGTKEELKEQLANEKLYSIEVSDINRIKEEEFFSVEGVSSVSLKENRVEITSLRGIENLDRIISILIKKGIRIVSLNSAAESLETVFLNLTGRSLRD
jgi:ABC-2 type transport system ATP-binding protein